MTSHRWSKYCWSSPNKVRILDGEQTISSHNQWVGCRNKDLSDFDKGQVVMASRLGQRVSLKQQGLWVTPGPGQQKVVTQDCNDGYGQNVSQLYMGLCCPRPIRVLIMTPVHRRKCLQRAHERQNWSSGRRLPGKWWHQDCTVGQRQASGVSLMLCRETMAIYVDVNLTHDT